MGVMPFDLISVQAHFPLGEREGNLEHAATLAEQAMVERGGAGETTGRGNSPGLILYPELFPSGYDPAAVAEAYGEEQDGISFQAMRRIALRHRLHVAYGYAEDAGGRKLHNSLMVIGPDGNTIANYRKIHLTQGEKALFCAGDDVVVAETELGILGLMICWDLAFPELARALSLGGAEFLLAPAAWDSPYADHYRSFTAMRALENSLFLAVSNHVGMTGGVDYCGNSGIFGPRGNLLTPKKGTADPYVRAVVDPEEIVRARNGYYTMLADRRSDIYGNCQAENRTPEEHIFTEGVQKQ